MKQRYIIGSSYYAKPGDGAEWFHRLWVKNTLKYSNPSKIIVVGTGAWPKPAPKVELVRLNGDLGHCDHLLKGERDFYMPSCTAAWMALAWIAYLNESDLIVKEQDCLAFGPWVEQIYSEIGDRKFMCGWSRMFGAATYLFLVKHEFIPQFCHDYVAEGRENILARVAETKVRRLIERDPDNYGHFSMGYDKDRPFDCANPVFAVQKLTQAEMLQLKSFGLIDFDHMPNVERFSNRA